MTTSLKPVMVITGRRLNDDELDEVRRTAPGFVVLNETIAVGDALSRVEVWAGPLPPEGRRRTPSLRWHHLWTAGADADLHTDEYSGGQVELTTSAGNGGIALAEHALMLMLMLDRDAPRWARAQNERSWDRYVHNELAGQTVGIIGMGAAGTDLARKCKAFHMQVIGLRNRPELRVDAVRTMYGPDHIHTFASGCDYLVVAAPLTQRTRGIVDANVFGVMKETASIINISRGEIVDEDALRDALRSGRIASAGLDAHAIEPLPPTSHWWSEARVIITPHNGATTAATSRRGLDIFLDNLQRYAAGRPLNNLVDTALGYAPR